MTAVKKTSNTFVPTLAQRSIPLLPVQRQLPGAVRSQ